MFDNWQRIEQIIKWTGAASVSAFAREIGLNRSENLYQIKRGNNGISRELAETITTKYPDLSKAWVLTGEGEMLVGGRRLSDTEIPLYRFDATEIGCGGLLPDPACNVSFPLFRDCDFAAYSYSDSMAPEIQIGSILFFRKVDKSAITPGSIYLACTDSFSVIRYIRKKPGSSLLRLVPKNNIDYDEVEIDPDKIFNLYLVRGIVINKTS